MKAITNTKDPPRGSVLVYQLQEPIQKTKQYITANQKLLNKENTVVIPLCTGTRGHSPQRNQNGR